MRKVLILTNSINGFYSFRNELLLSLLEKKYKVFLSAPYDAKSEYYIDKNVEVINTKINRRGKTIVSDKKLLFKYIRLMKKYKPDIVLTYTIKPNIYGGIAARLTKTPYISNITGLGTAVENKGLLQFITTRLYKFALKKAYTIFFQNQENMDFMLNRNIKGKSHVLIPGSGVNVDHFKYIDYPSDKEIHFLFIGRVMKAKGIDYYLEAAKVIKEKYPNTFFHILGGYEDDYKDILEDYEAKGYIKYHGRVDDVRKYHKITHAIIHPTFHEGMSNVLLEAAACGRPIIASSVPGCIETFDEGITGLGFKSKSTEELVATIERFIQLSYQNKNQMGIEGRKKIIKDFDRNIVTDAYIKEINHILEGK